jgi:hypothetical protein
LYVALSVKKAKLSLQVIKTKFLLANGKFCGTKAKFCFVLFIAKQACGKINQSFIQQRQACQ